MTVYSVTQMRFTDRATYDRYQSKFMGVFSKFDGAVVAADESPKVLEGEWPFEKAVILSFPSEEAFFTFATSPEYQEISKDRVTATVSTAILVKGIGS
ncbi:MAG: DUF1330 domain-containing protein [Pseudomonadota bacterium]